MTETSSKKPVRYMDFVGGRRASSTDPFVSRPRAKAVRPATQTSATKTAETKSVKPVAKKTPTAKASPDHVAVAKTQEKAFVTRKPATSRDLYPTTKTDTTTKPAESKGATKTAKSTANPQKVAAKLDEGPDNNAYVLGGKSPFLPDYSVEKRPLSASVKPKTESNFEKLSYLGVSDVSSEKPRKNVYEKTPEIELSSEETSRKSKKKPKAVKIIDDSDKKSGLSLLLVIILTIILGAAVGAGVYFILPK